MRARLGRIALLLFWALSVAACSTTGNQGQESGSSLSGFFAGPKDGPGRRHLVENVVEPVPMELPRSKYGNPKVYEVGGRFYETMDSSIGYRERGIASWYGSKFHGRLTSSREIYDMYQLTAAHRSLPIPTFVEVTNLTNGKSLIVKVNDRGPFHEDRVIDLSYAAAVKLDVIDQGTAPVEIRAIDPLQQSRSYNPVQIRQVTVAASQVEPPDASPVRSPPVSVNNPASSGIYVQLGAFADQINAQSLKTKVEAIIPGAVVQVLPSSVNLYRVHLGPIYSRSLVTEVLHDLDKHGVRNYHLISY